MLDFIVTSGMEFAAGHPAGASVLIAMSVMRMINKPLFSLVNAYVEATNATWDNEMWTKVKDAKATKVALYILDLTTSIKIKR